MNDVRVALNRRHFLACLSAMGLDSTLMPEALAIAAQDADIVTIDVLEAAQKIAGVSFTRAEQQAILTRLNATRGYMAGFAALRNASLRDDEQPAIVFNPVPPGKILPSGPRFTWVVSLAHIRRPSARRSWTSKSSTRTSAACALFRRLSTGST